MDRGKLINIAKSVINSEIIGLKAISDSLGKDFCDLVEKISKLKGRVILTGMGKSGIIAKKISSTLSSTGTPSFFVHPGEASHGDLGMITTEDIVILLSNSGETLELLDIINYCKRFSIFICCFTRNEDSSLANASDLKIILPLAPEALEFDAPTTSTIMMMALGDALALTILDEKGFSRDDFRIYHPGGRLGASFVKVKDVMHKGEEVPIVKEDLTSSETIDLMSEKKLGCAAVIDHNNDLIGIITDGNLRRSIKKGILSLKAADLMTRNPHTISEESLAIEALDLMNKNLITNLLVTKNQKVIGIIHMHDCLKAGANSSFNIKNDQL